MSYPKLSTLTTVSESYYRDILTRDPTGMVQSKDFGRSSCDIPAKFCLLGVIMGVCILNEVMM